MATVNKPGRTETRLSKYIATAIAGLYGVKTQRDIATEMGYEKANIISMFKTGDVKVPLDKLGALARALNADYGFILRLGLDQFHKDDNEGWAELDEFFDRLMTRNEAEIIDYIRQITDDTDPWLDEDLKHSLASAFQRR